MPGMGCVGVLLLLAFSFWIYGISKELKFDTEDLVAGSKVCKAL
jgi:hypothetical protein